MPAPAARHLMARRSDKHLDGKTPSKPTPPRLPRPPGAGVPPSPLRPTEVGARPGRRGDAPSDVQVTARLDRRSADLTPAPLPPSPAADDADRWFEQVPTHPGAPGATPVRPSGAIAVSDPPAVAATRAAPPWLFSVLLALTALTVGMVIGALLFGRAPACPACPVPAPVSPSR